MVAIGTRAAIAGASNIQQTRTPVPGPSNPTSSAVPAKSEKFVGRRTWIVTARPAASTGDENAGAFRQRTMFWGSIGSSNPADISPKGLRRGMGDGFGQLPPPTVPGRKLAGKIGCFLAGYRSFIARFE